MNTATNVQNTLAADDETPSIPVSGKNYGWPTLPWWSFLAEIGLVLVVALSIGATYVNAPPSAKIRGTEFERLTSATYYANIVYHQYGYIPLWLPLISYGEPVIDNPFSFILNPINTLPTLILDNPNLGLRISVALTLVVAGLGGWFLGRVLGFGWLGRVLLGLLFVGKGNMLAMIMSGYFQLGVTQAYFPWIIAGFIAMLRFRPVRWAPALTAVAFTLMFFAGNIWYTLPMILIMALLTLTHVIKFKRSPEAIKGLPIRLTLDWLTLRRVIFTFLLIGGLSMATLLPIWINRAYIGGHPDDWSVTPIVDPALVLQSMVAPDLPAGLFMEFDYSYILPLWFVALIAVLLLLRIRNIRRSNTWQIWGVLIVISLFTFFWGIGGQPLFLYLYNVIPLLGQWRFVGRAFAVTTFGIAILAAASINYFWAAVRSNGPTPRWLDHQRSDVSRVAAMAGAVALVGTTMLAAWQVNAHWGNETPVILPDQELSRYNEECVAWLRQTNPTGPLTVYELGYGSLYPFIQNNVRFNLAAGDFYLYPLASTLFSIDLYHNTPAKYAITFDVNVRSYLQQNGYQNMPDSPLEFDNHCAWQLPTALTFAYTIPKPALLNMELTKTLPTAATVNLIPDATVVRLPDQITFDIAGDKDQPLVLTIQEVAYPGWHVQLNGSEAHLESIGGQMGVVIPPGTQSNHIVFFYRPDLLFIGLGISLLTAFICLAYLLRLDRFVPVRRLRTALVRRIRPGIPATVPTSNNDPI